MDARNESKLSCMATQKGVWDPGTRNASAHMDPMHWLADSDVWCSASKMLGRRGGAAVAPDDMTTGYSGWGLLLLSVLGKGGAIKTACTRANTTDLMSPQRLVDARLRPKRGVATRQRPQAHRYTTHTQRLRVQNEANRRRRRRRIMPRTAAVSMTPSA